MSDIVLLNIYLDGRVPYLVLRKGMSIEDAIQKATEEWKKEGGNQMSIYRQFENPWKLEEQLAEAKQRLAENPENEDLALEVHELKERVNFAWQDNEAETEGYE